MAKQLTIEELLKSGSKQWNQLRMTGQVRVDHTGATFSQLFSANADLSNLTLIGSEWDMCDLSKVSFKCSDLSNSYFHGGRLQDCNFRGANLSGVTFEKLKMLRCDFTGADGLDEIEFDNVDMDRVTGLGGTDAPQASVPPAVGITSFTREQRTAALLSRQPQFESNLPPFLPGDSPTALLFRALKQLPNPPDWALDVPGLRLPLPADMPPGTSLELLYREAVKTRLEGQRPASDLQSVTHARQVIADGGAEVPLAMSYLHEVDEPCTPSKAAVDSLYAAFEQTLAIADMTHEVDPKLILSLSKLRSNNKALEYLDNLRRRLVACTLFTALLEAGFSPDNNWEEAVDSTETSQEQAHFAAQGDRKLLAQAFSAFASLPEELQMRRLAYLAESVMQLEAIASSTTKLET